MRIPYLTIAVLVCALSPGLTMAKDIPADVCELLAPAQLEKTFGVPFAAPEKSTAPSPYAANPPGTQCEYKAQKGPAIKVVFIAYVDPSVALAKQTFDRLAMFYRPKSKPAVGDSAYVDKNGAIHVLKGRVRYFIAIEGAGTSKSAPYSSWATGSKSSSDESAQENVVESLATAVAGEI